VILRTMPKNLEIQGSYQWRSAETPTGVRSCLPKGSPLVVLHACTMSLGVANTSCHCYETVSDELSCDVAMPTRDCAQQLHGHRPLNSTVKAARRTKIHARQVQLRAAANVSFRPVVQYHVDKPPQLELKHDVELGVPRSSFHDNKRPKLYFLIAKLNYN
jgi:hypothetical protein